MSAPRPDNDLLNSVVSSVLVPADTKASLDEILQDYPDVEQRSALYFDEEVKVLILLDLPVVPEEQLTWLLKRLELKVDAVISPSKHGSQESPGGGGLSSDLITSARVTKLEDPFTLVQESADDAEVRLQLVWQARLRLTRTRQRAAEQSIVFYPVADIVDSQGTQDDIEYLQPFKPLEPNVFQGLRSLPGIEHPYLPISRLQRMSLSAPKHDVRVHLNAKPSSVFQANAAFIPRLKYNKVNTYLPEPTTIATLDVELNPFIDIVGTIEGIDIAMENGQVKSLMPDFLPMTCKSKDCVAFLYELQSSQRPDAVTPADPSVQSSGATASNIDVLSIAITFTLQVSSASTTTIKTSWTTNVDFAPALNPSFGAPAQTLQRTNRPTSLNFSPYPDPNKKQSQDRTNTASVRTASTSLQHQIIPTSILRQPLTSALAISFTASDEPARVGIPFTWRILVVNNTSKIAKLAIVPLPRIQRSANANQHFAKRHAPKASSTTFPPAALAQKSHRHAGSYAKAVVEDHVLYALHHQAAGSASAVSPETDIMSLTAELRIGPLAPKACHEAEIMFIAYKTGVFNVDAIRVVDLTRESEGGIGVINDIRDLPEVVVQE